MTMQRICVIGTSGSGKTTLAKKLSQKLDIPFADSDSFFWQKGWQPAPHEVLQRRVLAATSGKAWVFDGNYLSLRSFLWQRADTIIWLDFSLPLILSRVCWRNTRRIIKKEQLWNNNRENWPRAWSGVRHSWSTYQEKRTSYPELLAQFPHLHIIHLRSPRQAERWLQAIQPSEKSTG